METRADGRDEDRSSSGSVLNLYGYRVLDGRCGAGREVKRRRRRWNRERGTDGRDARSLFYSTSRVGDADHGGETKRENARVFWR